MNLKKWIALCLCACMALLNLAAAETTQATPPEPLAGMEIPAQGGTPPEKPDGEMGNPPAMPGGSEMGNPPEMPGGGMGNPPDMPGGEMGNPPMGGPGGMNAQPESYSAVRTVSEDAEISGETIESTGADENALLVTGGNVVVSDSTLVRESADSTGGDNASFYGVGAAALVTGGTLTIENAEITTDAEGGAGVFAYGSGVATVKNTVISTKKGTSGGIHAAGGGTLYAENLTVTTEGASSAAIRSDRGGGTMVVNGGSYTASGFGSPAVYVTADISISDAVLTATGSEALCLEGKNNVTLTNCTLSGNQPDLEQNDNTWTVILYQSMSGDSELGKGTFTMTGGTLISGNGGLFYTTNTDSEFTLRGVTLQACEDSEYLLRCTGNANSRGWGRSGSNGASCVFTAAEQQMSGRVLWDSLSTLTLSLTEGTSFTGAILDDETFAGEGGSGTCTLTIDESSEWIVTESSTLTSLTCRGRIADSAGRTVTIADPSGRVFVAGDSELTITVSEYRAE